MKISKKNLDEFFELCKHVSAAYLLEESVVKGIAKSTYSDHGDKFLTETLEEIHCRKLRVRDGHSYYITVNLLELYLQKREAPNICASCKKFAKCAKSKIKWNPDHSFDIIDCMWNHVKGNTDFISFVENLIFSSASTRFTVEKHKNKETK